MQRSFCGKSSEDWVRMPLVSSSDFAIGVGTDDIEAVAEALVHLEGEGVVICVAYVVH